jgi:hypothetical protein
LVCTAFRALSVCTRCHCGQHSLSVWGVPGRAGYLPKGHTGGGPAPPAHRPPSSRGAASHMAHHAPRTSTRGHHAPGRPVPGGGLATGWAERPAASQGRLRGMRKHLRRNRARSGAVLPEAPQHQLERAALAPAVDATHVAAVPITPAAISVEPSAVARSTGHWRAAVPKKRPSQPQKSEVAREGGARQVESDLLLQKKPQAPRVL